MGVVREAACLHLLFLVFASMALDGGCIGVNWGRITSHPLPEDKIADMLVANGFKSVKLFDVDDASLRALMGRDIEVMIALPNLMMKDIAENPKLAAAWVQANVTKYIKPGGVNIRYVGIGNEPFLKDYKDRFLNVTLPALQNIQRALNDAKLGSRIKATVPCNADVLVSPGLPSWGDFRPDIHDVMIQMLKFYAANKAPFTVNIYPFLDVYYSPNFPFDYAFFDGVDSPMQDGNHTYTNVLDSSIDTLIWSMEKAGYGDIPIIVGEVGWPTDGDQHANIENARRFSQGLVRHLASDEGTPKRKGKLNVYMFSLMDEDMKSLLPGNFETHWGILGLDGQPKYKLDLSGRNRSKGLVGVKGIEYLAKKWCVFNPAKAHDVNLTSLAEAMTYACQRADCTSLSYGCSCYDLSIDGRFGNASYAFNQYYQGQNQQPTACFFDGLAKLTDKDPSNGTCIFPIMFLSHLQTSNSSSTNSSARNSPATTSSAATASSVSNSTETHSSARMNSSSKLAVVVLGALTVFLLASDKWKTI